VARDAAEDRVQRRPPFSGKLGAKIRLPILNPHIDVQMII
jgi:hypothetical protein